MSKGKYLIAVVCAALLLQGCQTARRIGHGTKSFVQTVDGHKRRVSTRQMISEAQQKLPSERDQIMKCVTLFAVQYKDNAALASEIAAAATTACSAELDAYRATAYEIAWLTRILDGYRPNDFDDQRFADEQRKEEVERARGRALQAVIESRNTQSPQSPRAPAAPL